MQEFTKDDLTAVLATALTRFRAELGADVTASRILTLLTISRNPGMSQPELGMHIKDLSQQGQSRNVLDLSARTSTGAPGPDLVRIEPDPAFRRRNILSPTQNALKLFSSLTADVNRVVRNRARAN
jgi:DNA-binding MarR family transcriptional regulator